MFIYTFRISDHSPTLTRIHHRERERERDWVDWIVDWWWRRGKAKGLGRRRGKWASWRWRALSLPLPTCSFSSAKSLSFPSATHLLLLLPASRTSSMQKLTTPIPPLLPPTLRSTKTPSMPAWTTETSFSARTSFGNLVVFFTVCRQNVSVSLVICLFFSRFWRKLWNLFFFLRDVYCGSTPDYITPDNQNILNSLDFNKVIYIELMNGDTLHLAFKMNSSKNENKN